MSSLINLRSLPGAWWGARSSPSSPAVSPHTPGQVYHLQPRASQYEARQDAPAQGELLDVLLAWLVRSSSQPGGGRQEHAVMEAWGRAQSPWWVSRAQPGQGDAPRASPAFTHPRRKAVGKASCCPWGALQNARAPGGSRALPTRTDLNLIAWPLPESPGKGFAHA